MIPKRGGVDHIEVNVSDLAKSKGFYESVLKWMGYERILEGNNFVAWGNGEVKIFLAMWKNYKAGFHRRRVGLNHIAFRAESRLDVDKFYREFLIQRKIRILYGGPKPYPEYSPTYYAVYFEDPDRIKLEYVYRTD